MGYGIKFRVWGEYACFTRTEMKAERLSYDVITPTAAKGVIESIFWKPSIRWVIDKITVLSPIVFGNIKLNEVKKTANMPKKDLSKMKEDDYFLYIQGEDNRAQRNVTYLKNPHYLIEAHFESTGFGADTEDFKKHYNIVLRRLQKGQFFKQPCLGLAAFNAHVQLVEEHEHFVSPLTGVVDLGLMPYQMKYKVKEEKTPLPDTATDEEKWARRKECMTDSADTEFFHAMMRDGVIDVQACLKSTEGGAV